MDVNQLLNVLEQVLDLGDKLDSSGGGVLGLSGGKTTTREMCRLQLMQFLFYVGYTNARLTEGQVSLLNVVLHRDRSLTESEYCRICRNANDLNPESDLTLKAFIQGDAALSAKSGMPSTQLTDILITTYEAFGTLMIAMDEQPLANVRLNNFIEGMKNIVAEAQYSKAGMGGTRGTSHISTDNENKHTGNRRRQDYKTVRFDSRVSFSLPDDYKAIDSVDKDGKKELKIELNSHPNNGEENGDTTFNISIVDQEESGIDIMEGVLSRNRDVAIKRKLNSEPESILLINQMNLSVLGASIVWNVYRLFIRLSEKEALLIFSQSTNDNEEELLAKLQDIWNRLQIDGKAVKTCDFDCGDIINEGKKALEEEEKYDNEAIDNTIRINGNNVRIGDRWEMKLPFNWRATVEEDEESEHTKLTIFSDSLPYGHALFAKTVGMQKKRNTAIDAAAMPHTIQSSKFINDSTIRDDDRMKVTISLCVCTDGVSIAQIHVIEKNLYGNDTLIHLILTSYIDDLPGAIQKIKDKDFYLGHPFGLEYENKWMGALRLAASIQPIGEKEEATELQAKTTLYKDIKWCIPKGMKLLKREDGMSFVCYPTSKTPSEEDFKRSKKDCALIVNLSVDNDIDTSNDQMSSNTRAGLFSRYMVRSISGLGAERIIERFTANGHLSLWMNPRNQEVIVGIALGNGNQVIIRVSSDAQKSLNSQLRIGFAVFNSIEISGESRYVCATPFPPGTELLHEHYDLVESGQYTTHRSADFVGQSIRELLKKHGNSRKSIYRQMAIREDKYSLDKNAVALAKVFRLNEELFDPYGDTEAMIRKAMFKNARAFQTLRSLAWSISALSDQEGRAFDDYSYEELEKIGILITENNNINYQAYSYCSGLCNHYDWHVFYVPDAYLAGEGKEDLRFLTGKENRGGNSITIVGLGGVGNMTRVSDIISRNEETLESLEALRKDLEDLLPVMQTIYNGLLTDRDRSKGPEGTLADALTAWCALAIAAKEPFYSEEAADTPEADAALDSPLQRPTDDLDEKPVKTKIQRATTKSTGKTTKKTGTNNSAESITKNATASKRTPAEESPNTAEAKTGIRKLEMHGETTIQKFKYHSDSDTRPIEIPEGVIKIESNAFLLAKTTSLKLPKSLRVIADWAFNSCPNLSSIEIPEGLQEIGACVVYECPNLTKIELPSSIQKVNRNAFSKNSLTVYVSGDVARRLVKGNENKLLSTIDAAGFMIDGTWYPTLEKYVEKIEAEEKARIERERQERERREIAARREQQKNALLKQIRDLEAERDAAKGLFAGGKRKRLQAQIDELYERLRRLT